VAAWLDIVEELYEALKEFDARALTRPGGPTRRRK
jgi:hypothetical protein